MSSELRNFSHLFSNYCSTLFKYLFRKEAVRIARKKRARLSKRFWINAVLFVALFLVFLVFHDEYAAIRDEIRSDIIGTARNIASDIGDSDLPSLHFGANYEKLSGQGEKISASDAGMPTNTGESLRFPAVMYPYRALLNTDAQAVYNQVYANALSKNTERFTLVRPVSESVLSDIMNAVYNDHPELFWVDTAYSYGFLKSNSVITVTLTFNETISDIEESEKAFAEAVDRVVQNAKEFRTDIEREKFVHDYLMQKTDYDVNAPMNQSAFSAIVSGESVCAGYARAFQHILMQLDIPCYYVTGTAAGGDHAWNIIALGGDYYNVDPSWNDAAGTAYGTLNYSYFNLPDSQFSLDHTRSSISSLLPACKGTLMSYGTPSGSSQIPVTDSAAGVTKLPTYASLGYVKSDIISSMNAYNDYCREKLISLGVGKNTFMMVLKNLSLKQKVSEAAENNAYVQGYAQDVVNALRLQNCKISLQLSFENLADGYVLLKQTVSLTGESIPATTPEPTVTPTPVVTPIPTAVPTSIPTLTNEPVDTPVVPTAAPHDTVETSATETPVANPEDVPKAQTTDPGEANDTILF